MNKKLDNGNYEDLVTHLLDRALWARLNDYPILSLMYVEDYLRVHLGIEIELFVRDDEEEKAVEFMSANGLSDDEIVEAIERARVELQ